MLYALTKLLGKLLKPKRGLGLLKETQWWIFLIL